MNLLKITIIGLLTICSTVSAHATTKTANCRLSHPRGNDVPPASSSNEILNNQTIRMDGNGGYWLSLYLNSSGGNLEVRDNETNRVAAMSSFSFNSESSEMQSFRLQFTDERGLHIALCQIITTE